jgi:hypothetical protein
VSGTGEERLQNAIIFVDDYLQSEKKTGCESE